MEKKINDMTDRMLEDKKKRITEYSLCFNQSRENYGEAYSSLGSPRYEVSLCDNFEPPYLARPHLNDVMALPSLEQESDLPTSLSLHLAPHPSSLKDATENVPVYAHPPVPFNDSYEFEVGEQFDTARELDMSIQSDIKHHEIDESEEAKFERHIWR